MRYAEDLTPGHVFAFGTWTMTESDIVAYAKQWDPLPMHIDPEAARAGPHGGIIASGLHTLAIYQRLLVDALWKDVQGIGGRSFRLQFRRPVKPGMVLTGQARIERVQIRPDRGNAVVDLVSELTADGQVVFEIATDAIILCRSG